MGVPAIVLGDAKSVLRLSPAKMLNPGAWSQLDSDIAAHYLQVHGQISRSRWNKSKIEYTVQGGKLLSYEFPPFEDFVFAAVYFRQLIATKDDLLNDAADRYRRFADCQIRTSWIHEEQKRFHSILNDARDLLPGYTVCELFDAFMYGASLMHKAPHIDSKHRTRFLQIYDAEPREQVLYALNMSMKLMLNHVGNIAVVLRRDFAEWLHDHSLPLPDVRWHDRLFEIPRRSTNSQSTGDGEYV